MKSNFNHFSFGLDHRLTAYKSRKRKTHGRPYAEAKASTSLSQMEIEGKMGLAANYYSKPFFATGEHVLAGEGLKVPFNISTINLGQSKNVSFTYAEIIAMADLYKDFNQMANAPDSELRKLRAKIRQSRNYYDKKVRGLPKSQWGSEPSDADWDTITNKRYSQLAIENFAHFAPSSKYNVGDHKASWEYYHEKAMDVAIQGAVHRQSSPLENKMLAINAFGDHFLTDAFSAGHLFNKQLVIDTFNNNMTGSKAITLFTNVAKWIYNDPSFKQVVTKFSRYEPNKSKYIDPDFKTPKMFVHLLSGIHSKRPEMFGKTAIAKIIHDKLNHLKGGIPVTNNYGDKWNLRGDGTLDMVTLNIMKKAVEQSIKNLMDAPTLDQNAYPDYLLDLVWGYVPRPTPQGQGTINRYIVLYTNPDNTQLAMSIAEIIRSNLDFLLQKLLDEKEIRKADDTFLGDAADWFYENVIL